MSFGFSATDFVKVIELVVQLSDALRAFGDARSKFRDLILELFALENALLQVKRLELPEELEFRRLALYTAASTCQECIDDFWSKVRHLQPHMQSSTSSSRKIKAKWAQIKWAMCKSSDVDQFRATIRGHTGSIEILLAAIQSDVIQLESKKHSEEHKTLAGMIQTASCQVLAKLNIISRSVAQTVQQGKALLDASALVLRSNIQVFAMVNDIHVFMRRIPGQVQQQQVLLTDPFNRIRPMDLSTIISEEAFLHVMRCIFRDMGSNTEKLDQGDYMIEEAGTGREIKSSIPWSARFAPGQNVTMSIVFKQTKSQSTSCPRCKAQQDGSSDEEVTCTKCQTVYRRIEESDDNQLHRPSLAVSDESDDSHVCAASNDAPRQSVHTAAAHEETVETSAYRRIRIIEVRDAGVLGDIAGKLVQFVDAENNTVAELQPLESILRIPAEKFPGYLRFMRESILPLPDRPARANTKGIPAGAKWTKIDRRLVNPQALAERGERFEERREHVIVLRVLTKDEIQAFANRTQDIRGEASSRETRLAPDADITLEERAEYFQL